MAIYYVNRVTEPFTETSWTLLVLYLIEWALDISIHWKSEELDAQNWTH